MSARTDDAALARLLVERLGGRFSRELGIDLDAGDGEAERWALAAALFGTRISTPVVLRTYRTLEAAGVRTPADAGARTWDELVALLDAGGYARYDFRTASRLLRLAAVLAERHGGRVASLAALREPAALEAALDALPGFGPVTVRLFLRELRGVWPGARPPLDERAAWAAGHVGLAPVVDTAAALDRLAERAGVDPRDLEAALVRLALAHRRASTCPGGPGCGVLR